MIFTLLSFCLSTLPPHPRPPHARSFVRSCVRSSRAGLVGGRGVAAATKNIVLIINIIIIFIIIIVVFVIVIINDYIRQHGSQGVREQCWGVQHRHGAADIQVATAESQ